MRTILQWQNLPCSKLTFNLIKFGLAMAKSNQDKPMLAHDMPLRLEATSYAIYYVSYFIPAEKPILNTRRNEKFTTAIFVLCMSLLITSNKKFPQNNELVIWVHHDFARGVARMFWPLPGRKGDRDNDLRLESNQAILLCPTSTWGKATVTHKHTRAHTRKHTHIHKHICMNLCARI